MRRTPKPATWMVRPTAAHMLPTRDGLDRYPSTRGFYRRGPGDGYRFPCRCRPGCLMPCDGVCGCAACKLRVVDARIGRR